MIPDAYFHSPPARKVDTVDGIIRYESPLHGVAESLVEDRCMITYGRIAEAYHKLPGQITLYRLGCEAGEKNMAKGGAKMHSDGSTITFKRRWGEPTLSVVLEPPL
jgi:hypothetical protein